MNVDKQTHEALEGPDEAPSPSATHGPPSVPTRWQMWAFAGSAVALLGVTYGPALAELARRWWTDPSYSHGFLVPFLSAALAGRWYRRERPALGPSVSRLGVGEMLAGFVIHAAATVIVFPPLDFVGLVCVLRGLALILGGTEWGRGLRFPILFLFFLFPLPAVWTSAVAVWLQDVVATLAAGMLKLFWVCHRQGNAIHLPGLDQPLFVAEECSGLRQIVAFVALAALLGAWNPRPSWQRIVLVLAAVPVAIVANLVRVLLMAIGAKWFGDDWLSGWMHDLPGIVTLPLGLGLLLLSALGLQRGQYWLHATFARWREAWHAPPPAAESPAILTDLTPSETESLPNAQSVLDELEKELRERFEDFDK